MVLAKASELANLCGAKLVVIHVLPYKLLPSDYQKTLKEDIAPKIEKLLLPLASAKRTVTLKWASLTRLFAEKQRSARPIW